MKDQELTNRINSLGQENSQDEEVKASGADEGSTSDYIISTGSGDEGVNDGRKYKVVASALDF